MIILGVQFTIVLKFLVTLLAIINPFSCAGIYLDTVKKSDNKERAKIVISIVFAVFIVLSIMVWLGSSILNAFGINESAFRAGGGIIVLFFGVRIVGVISSNNGSENNKKTAKELAIVPLAIPLIAGPGTIATVISESHKYFLSPEAKLVATFCIFVLVFILWMFFTFLPKISSLLGENLMDVLSKIMGLVLVAIATEMIFDGIKGFFFSS